jgi:hypothetical protein
MNNDLERIQKEAAVGYFVVLPSAFECRKWPENIQSDSQYQWTSNQTASTSKHPIRQPVPVNIQSDSQYQSWDLNPATPD